jgi:hypothetical protein
MGLHLGGTAEGRPRSFGAADRAQDRARRLRDPCWREGSTRTREPFSRGESCRRERFRTSDPYRVKVVLYH